MVPPRPSQGNDPLLHFEAVAAGGSGAAAQADALVAGALRALLAHDVAAWPAHGLALVKQRTVRSVFAGALGGVPVHVKVFRPDTFGDQVRDLLRRARGGVEAGNLQRARALGLPVVEPLAHGFASDGGRKRSFVVTRTAAGAPFTWQLAADTRRAVGSLLRRIDDLGVRLGDLHPGNLLVGPDGDLHLLDLTAMAAVGEVDLRTRARALAFVCHELDGGARDPLAAPLLAGYQAAGAMPASFVDELVLATRRWRADALPAFGRRASRTCKHTEVPKRARAQPRWHWHLPGDDAGRRARCEQFAAAPPPPDKSGRRGAVWLQPAFAVKDRDAGKARKLWRASYWLLFARVPAPTPIALRLHQGRGYVFVQNLGHPSLAQELAAGALTAATLPAVARRIGDSVGRLHAHGLRNRDLKLDNLVRDPRTGDVAMVDLDGVRRGAADETRGRGADLGRLLAAFRAAGSPGGEPVRRAFVRGYLRAHRRLLQVVPLRRVLRRAEQRAGEWLSAHR